MCALKVSLLAQLGESYEKSLKSRTKRSRHFMTLHENKRKQEKTKLKSQQKVIKKNEIFLIFFAHDQSRSVVCLSLGFFRFLSVSQGLFRVFQGFLGCSFFSLLSVLLFFGFFRVLQWFLGFSCKLWCLQSDNRLFLRNFLCFSSFVIFFSLALSGFAECLHPKAQNRNPDRKVLFSPIYMDVFW